ncbi:MAG: restriction endonuclease subunit S [Peptoniphilaceae bacterium]|nr:restriction endonuclease subunit S [Peptoniphilaceae bacterium]
MSKIDELLKNEKVEWKKLGEVCDIKRGRVISKTYLEQNTGEFPVYSSQTRNKGEIGRINTYDFDGEYATWTTDGAYAGTVFYRNGKFSITNICGLITPKDDKKLLVKFIVYWLQIEAKKHVKGGSGNPKLMSNVVESIKIPIPSIETQEKIVKILDKFTNYVTELQTELQKRTKQYEYYRDMLLSEEYLNKLSNNPEILGANKIKVTTIGEVADVIIGGDVPKNNFSTILTEKYNIPIYSNGIEDKALYGYTDKARIDKASVTISARGTIGYVSYREFPYYPIIRLLCLIPKKDLKAKYLYYLLQNTEIKHNEKGIPSLTSDMIKRIEIQIPSVLIQSQVVQILDKFQSLLSDTKGLLPHEIEQRQKQYEYYREKLLTFDENCVKRERERAYLSNSYLNTLKEAAEIVGIKLFEVEWKTLGSIGVFENGTGMPKSLFNENGNVGAIHYGHIYTKYNLSVKQPIVRVTKQSADNLKKVNTGDLVIAKTSENIEDVMKTVAYLGNTIAVTGGHAAIFKHNENPKYLSYVFNGANYLLRQKNKLARGVKVIELSTKDMEKIKIPLPSLPVQEYIVAILDKFDALINDVSKGIPKEIELRQKQYEYYREKLLTFER